MAEQVVLVCDTCGRAAVTTVRISVDGKNFDKDLCGTHFNTLVKDARAPKRGRKRKVSA